MEEQTKSEAQVKEEKGRKKLLFILLAILAILIIVAVLVYGIMSRNYYDANASSISNASQSYEEIVKELNEKTEASRLWISVANTFRVKPDGTAYAQASDGSAVSVIDNIERNTKDIKYVFYLDGTNGEDAREIYESGLIAPGQSIENPTIDISGLQAGSYEVTVTAQGYDIETHLATGGKVSAQVTMIVE
jgi:preprotein translocase subunit SecG